MNFRELKIVTKINEYVLNVPQSGKNSRHLLSDIHICVSVYVSEVSCYLQVEQKVY